MSNSPRTSPTTKSSETTYTILLTLLTTGLRGWTTWIWAHEDNIVGRGRYRIIMNVVDRQFNQNCFEPSAG